MKYHLTLVRMVITKKIHWQGCGERETFLHCRCKYNLVTSLRGIVPQKI